MISLYNTLTNKKETFTPLDPSNIKMYVCGPTVYDWAHIGNARSAVVYDVLFRLLTHTYGNVTYVRNITDIDDKIIDSAKQKKRSIEDITSYYTAAFQQDMDDLNCIKPTFEPKVTQNITEIIDLIERLIKNGNAYVVDQNVYFSIESYPKYGQLSGRKTAELIHGSRIETSAHKKHPGDFILWKPATDVDFELQSFWSSPWGNGRPGWHIECSAMSYSYLGENFDMHGGGADLQFPHHENEIAQSCCAFPSSQFARYWIHNGFVTVDGEKMSKSLGNIVKVRDLLQNGVKGEVIRYTFLKTHYRKPLDWTDETLATSKEALDRFYGVLSNASEIEGGVDIAKDITSALKNDLNTPEAISILHEMATEINKTHDNKEKAHLMATFLKSANFLGILTHSWQEWFKVYDEEINKLVEQRTQAKKNGDFAAADTIRAELLKKNILLSDQKDGTTKWYRKF
ncbi:MAG: cysteine--tRNA ligase [Candidatus Mesenet longicola]|uniref:Cysteine--tRNA ligase n=1 Tax=Candidatus Mesenet longicola TaxID=1892558 RepID=A0A8J3HXJ0_9RICK|nr:MAG: cysteine--tRNA ligase [Candidatus Mesenet longicola]GHM59371.1 MAG: cysteine--tRNA ligase [Candidatus Mesenet longicola]